MSGKEVKTKKRENWGSRIGFILAAAGSAVGLGNIWRFPYTAGENGGGAFLLLYLFFIVVIGFTVMLGEFTLGRKSKLAAFGAFKSVGKNFSFVGVMGVVSAFLIMGFYPVVGGWATAYIFKSFSGLLSDPNNMKTVFEAFTASSYEPIFWTGMFLLFNIAIVIRGISSGIEKASMILMPILFGILILIGIKSLSLDNAMKGVEFLFKPDFSKVNHYTWLAALGQTFFSLSLGMGTMVTYGSYLDKKENLASNAAIVTGLGTLVAILAGLAMFPALFSYGYAPEAGPGLVFIIVPKVFSEFQGMLGPIFSALFFVALTVAALTSSVSLMEVAASFFIDERKYSRAKSVTLVGVIMFVVSIFSSLSLGSMKETDFYKFVGANLFDIFDLLTDKIFLSLGGMLLAIIIGFFMKKEDLRKEITSNGNHAFPFFNLWFFAIKYIVPVSIFVVALVGITGTPQVGLMIFGVLSIFILQTFSSKF